MATSSLFSELLLEDISPGEASGERILQLTVRAWERYHEITENANVDYALGSWYADLNIESGEATIESVTAAPRYQQNPQAPVQLFHADINNNNRSIEAPVSRKMTRDTQIHVLDGDQVIDQLESIAVIQPIELNINNNVF